MCIGRERRREQTDTRCTVSVAEVVGGRKTRMEREREESVRRRDECVEWEEMRERVSQSVRCVRSERVEMRSAEIMQDTNKLEKSVTHIGRTIAREIHTDEMGIRGVMRMSSSRWSSCWEGSKEVEN